MVGMRDVSSRLSEIGPGFPSAPRAEARPRCALRARPPRTTNISAYIPPHISTAFNEHMKMVLCSIMSSVARAARSGVGSRCCRRAAALYSTEYKNRYYTKKHEWVSVNDDIGTVGISSFAQEALGEVVFAALPEPGAALAAGEECGALESVKAAGEIYTPVSGTVTESNATVESSPSLINASCYSSGWLFRLRLSRPEELHNLMDQAAYDQYLKDQH